MTVEEFVLLVLPVLLLIGRKFLLAASSEWLILPGEVLCELERLKGIFPGRINDDEVGSLPPVLTLLLLLSLA